MMKAKRRTATLVVPLLLQLMFSPTLSGLAQAQTPADLTRLVVIGDSLSAGYMNSSLLDSQQIHGYANVIATQARTPMTLPLIGAPGIPNVLQLVSLGPPPVVEPAPGVSPGRTNPDKQATNLAVPGHTVHDALSLRPGDPIDSLTDLVLGLPGLFLGIARSQVEWAEALDPTTVIVWIGSQDALNAVLLGDPSALTPVAQFETDYIELMDRLSATGASLIVANVPDVTVIPFLVPSEQLAAELGQPLSILELLLGIGSGDYVTLDAFPAILAILANPGSGPLPADLVLTAGEVAEINAAVASYNQIIAEQARAKGAALVDINAILSSIKARGLVVHGQRLTTNYLGGLFSLDGIHPTFTGHAVIADEFIHVLNARLHAGIPPIALAQVAKTDPLVLPGVGHPASALGQMGAEIGRSLRSVLLRR
jgi:phospholipase/lecithinase/hemolysin